MADVVIRIDPLAPESATLPPGLSARVSGPGELWVMWTTYLGRGESDWRVRWLSPYAPIRFTASARRPGAAQWDTAATECVACLPAATDAEVAGAVRIEPEVWAYS
jgi:hypothetical protein